MIKWYAFELIYKKGNSSDKNGKIFKYFRTIHAENIELAKELVKNEFEKNRNGYSLISVVLLD